MALLEVDLRTALVAALRANTALASVLGNASGSLVHVEGSDMPDLFLQGAQGRVWCRVADHETLEEFEVSAKTRFRFDVLIDLVDMRGTANALSTARQGIMQALADKGAGIFTTYFTDNGSNRLGGSGVWNLENIAVVPYDQQRDPDRPEILATIACELWHVSPLV